MQGDGTEASKVLLMENMLLRGYEEKAQIKETMNGKAPTLLVPQRQDKPTKEKSRKFKVVPVSKLLKPTKILLKVIAEQLRRRWHGTDTKPKKRLDNFLLAALLNKGTPNSVMTETELEETLALYKQKIRRIYAKMNGDSSDTQACATDNFFASSGLRGVM